MAADLPKGNTVLSSDPRPIQGVDIYRVGTGGVTRIDAYDESGEMSHVPWIAVFLGEQIAVRFPARRCSIHYKESEELSF